MLTVALFRWWYGSGWLWCLRQGKQQISGLVEQFSVTTLLKTLGAPWKQIISRPNQQSGLDAKFRALIDNMVSRIVGFCVRSIVLIAAGLLILLWAFLGFIAVFIWPVIPLAPVILLLATMGIL